MEERRSRRKGRSRSPRTSGIGLPLPRSQQELDAQHSVATALTDRGFAVRQNVAVPGRRGFADIYAERGDTRILVEVKRKGELRTPGQLADAMDQAFDYSDALQPPYVAISDGDLLILDYDGKRIEHQLCGGVLLSVSEDISPLDLGATYSTFRRFAQQQRNVVTPDGPLIVREKIFDLQSVLANESPDLVFIGGESGSGKSTYLQQLIGSQFDPMWLDCALITDACDALATAVASTGYTGDTLSFLQTLRAYAERDAWSIPVIVIDAIDEWPDARRPLRELLSLTVAAQIKLIVVGRPQQIELLESDKRFLVGITHIRYDVDLFSDEEHACAEEAYRKAFELKSLFLGRALELSKLPAMMAAISETYQGRAVNPDLTEPQLYLDYRKLKARNIALRHSISPDHVEADIDAVALRMLELDSVSLKYLDARAATSSVDSLVSEGLLLRETSGRHVRLRFRFGRFRDDALASSDTPFAILFAARVTGRSALVYAAKTNVETRRLLLTASLEESALEGVILARDFDWWDDFVEVLPSTLSEAQRFTILGYAGRTLTRCPQLLDRLGVDARSSFYAAVHGVRVSPEVWRSWHSDLEDLDVVASLCQITLRMLDDDSIAVNEAIQFVELARQRYARNGRLSEEDEHFWKLIQSICRRVEPLAVRKLLRDVIPSFSIVHSSADPHMGSFYHGLNHGNSMIEAVGELRRVLSPRAFEAWASVTLLRAYMQEYRPWGGFRGAELSGSETDNAWVADVIVPSMREALRASHLTERLRRYKISPLHPAFRLRAIIACAPIHVLESLPDTMTTWRRMRNPGIPSLSDSLDSRASDSELISAQGLNDALERFARPLSEVHSRLLHRRIAQGNRDAIAAARHFLSDPQFVQTDHFLTRFLEQLDWTSQRPRLAVELLAIAVRAGYPLIFLGHLHDYRILFDLLLRHAKLRRIVTGIDGFEDQFAYALRDSHTLVRRRHTLRVYREATTDGRQQVLFWVNELPINLALTIVREGFAEDHPTETNDNDVPDKHGLPDGSFHAVLWSALIYCSQTWRRRWFHLLGYDLVAEALRFSSPVDVAATIVPLCKYAVEFRMEIDKVTRVIDYVLDRGESASAKLRAYIAAHTTNLCSAMTPSQLDRYLKVYADTPEAVQVTFDLVQQRGLSADVIRLLGQAEKHRERSLIAGILWRDLRKSRRHLSGLEIRVIDRLIDNADIEVVRRLMLVAIELSHVSAGDGTQLLMKILRRALAVNAHLAEPYEMQYAWDAVAEQTVLDFAAEVSASQQAGWLSIKLAAEALAARGVDLVKTRRAFEALVNAHDGARDAFNRWRTSVSQ